MKFKSKLLTTSCITLLSLQQAYGSNQDNDWMKGDQSKKHPSHNYNTGININSEFNKQKEYYQEDKYGKKSREPQNAFEVIESLRQKKSSMTGFPTKDVEEGLGWLSHFISSEQKMFREENDNLKKHLYTLENKLELANKHYENLIREKGILEQEKEEHSRKIDDLQKNLEQKDTSNKNLEKDLRDKEQDSEFLKKENDRLLGEYKGNKQDLKDEIKDLQTKFEEKVNLLRDNQKELSFVQSKIINLEKEKKSLSLDFQKQNEEIQILQTGNKNLQEMYFNVERERNKLEQEKVFLSNHLMSIQGDLKEKEKVIQKGTKFVSALDKERQDLEETSKEKGFKLENIEEKLKVFQDLSKQREEELFKKEESIKSLKEEIGQKQERISILEKENSIKDQIPLLRGNLITILSILGKPSTSDNLIELSTDLMQAVILKLSQK